MKQLDENPQSLSQADEERPLKKSFLRAFLPKKSSSSLSLEEKENAVAAKKNKNHRNRESRLESGEGDESFHILLKKDKLRSLNKPQSSSHRSNNMESLPHAHAKQKLQTTQFQNGEPVDNSRPIHWVVPDYVNENRSQREIINKHRDRQPKKIIDDASHKQGNKSIQRTVKRTESEVNLEADSSMQVLPKHNRHSVRKPESREARIPNVSNKAATKILRSSGTNQKLRPRKKALTIESPTRTKTRKLLNLVAELRKTCDVYRREIKHAKDQNIGEVLHLQRENEILNMELYTINGEVEEWKSRCRKQENQNTALVKVKTLTKKTSILEEDIGVLKSVIHRLNKEISFYQDKLRIQCEYLPNQAQLYSTSSSNCSKNETKEIDSEENFTDVLKEPTKKLFPLLVAYDEVIKEKNEIIKTHEETLEKFKAKCQEVVQENYDLHEIIADRKEKGMVSIQEWEFLHANSVIVLEENDLLHEQLSILKQKSDFIIKNHQDKVSSLKTKISLLEEEKSRLKSAAIKTETHCKLLIDQHEKLAEIIEKRIPLEQHEVAVLECKKLFEELKSSYGDERTVLMEKLSVAEKERDRLALELAELEATNGRIQSNIKTCENTLAVNAAQFREIYNRMIVATNARETTTLAIEEMMELSQRVVSERENTEQLLHEQRSLNEKLILLRERECELISELHGKIKAMEDIHQKELERLIFRIKELEKIINGIGESHKHEMRHLEELIQEKVKVIDHLETEKRQLQSDLETVWKTTTSTIKDLNNK